MSSSGLRERYGYCGRKEKSLRITTYSRVVSIRSFNGFGLETDYQLTSANRTAR